MSGNRFFLPKDMIVAGPVVGCYQSLFVEMIAETNKVPTYTVTQRTKRDSNSCSVFQQVSKVYNSYTLTFSTRRFFTTSYYVGVAATTC